MVLCVAFEVKREVLFEVPKPEQNELELLNYLRLPISTFVIGFMCGVGLNVTTIIDTMGQVNMGKLALLFALFFVSPVSFASALANYNGFWWNEDRSGIFELVVSEQLVEGKTRWGKEPKIDSHNPDPTLRSRSLKDMTFLWGFEYQPKDNSWQNGQVYDTNNGKTYSANMRLEKGGKILEMRGYIGISLFGRSARFERVEPQDLPAELRFRN